MNGGWLSSAMRSETETVKRMFELAPEFSDQPGARNLVRISKYPDQCMKIMRHWISTSSGNTVSRLQKSFPKTEEISNVCVQIHTREPSRNLSSLLYKFDVFLQAVIQFLYLIQIQFKRHDHLREPVDHFLSSLEFASGDRLIVVTVQ